MQPLEPQTGYVQFLVVRESQREQYSKVYGQSYAIVALPDTLKFTYSAIGKPLNLTVEHGGIGYARLFCQLLAYSLDLPEIWMLDDNVRRWYEDRASHR